MEETENVNELNSITVVINRYPTKWEKTHINVVINSYPSKWGEKHIYFGFPFPFYFLCV